MLSDVELLQSGFSFELGTLIETAFIELPFSIQDAIQLAILNIHQESAADTNRLAWRLHEQAQLILL